VRTWQATQWLGEISFSTCSLVEHEGTRSAQRVWKRQPEGGLIGGIGTAESSASVYGCFGLV
jgi:hypothetical protein